MRLPLGSLVGSARFCPFLATITVQEILLCNGKLIAAAYSFYTVYRDRPNHLRKLLDIRPVRPEKVSAPRGMIDASSGLCSRIIRAQKSGTRRSGTTTFIKADMASLYLAPGQH